MPMSEEFEQFQNECKTRLEANRHYQMYLSAARTAQMREAFETIALCFYIEGRLDERGGDEYDKAVEHYELTVDRPL